MVPRIPNGPAITYRPVMIFIDGGYLRKCLDEIFGDDRIDFGALANWLTAFWSWGNVHGELIRAYYYDAIVDREDDPEEHNKQQEYFDSIRNNDCYEVRLGRLIKTRDGYRQKGVDILITLDMITKAFLGQYDVAYLLGGDDDFVDLVRSVKTLTGKRVYGIYFSKHISTRLLECFDYRRQLDAQSFIVFLKSMMKKQFSP